MVDILCRSATHFSGTSMRVFTTYLKPPWTKGASFSHQFIPVSKPSWHIYVYRRLDAGTAHGVMCTHTVICDEITMKLYTICSSIHLCYKHIDILFIEGFANKKHWFNGCCNNVQASLLYIMTSQKFGECSKLYWVSEHGGTLYLWL
jgi:hypothetical protein